MSVSPDEKPLGFTGAILNLPMLLYVLNVTLTLMPWHIEISTRNRNIGAPYALLATLTLVIACFQYRLRSGKQRQAKDVASVVLLFFLVWEASVTKLDLMRYIFIPTPENVFNVFQNEWAFILKGLARSMFLLLTGFVGSLIAGVSLGIAVGWFPRLREAIFPMAKAVSTVPAIIYGPYIVAVMPTFTSASVLVIFCGTFFSTFMNMINRVGTIDARIINTAKVLNVGTRTMLFDIIMPYTLPRIINDMSVALSVSMMTLTVAEMIGASSGIGYFVRSALAYANYNQAIAGIFFIALVITILQALVSLLKKKLVNWNY